AERHVGDGALLRAHHVGDHHQDAVEDGVPGDDGDVPLEIGVAEFLEEYAEGDGGNGSEHDIDGEASVVCDPAPQQVEGAHDQPPHIAPEINENGEKRAEMRHDVDNDALVLPMHDLRDQDQVA